MKKTKAIQACLPCLVLRDKREREEGNRWEFKSSEWCAGTQDSHLKTGDYTIKGFESKFVIERKSSINDFVQSMARKQFEAELERMADITHPFVVLEFPMEELRDWPQSSRQPPHIQERLPLIYPGAAFARFLSLKLAHPYVDFTFAGSCGKLLAGSIFKRIIEAYASEYQK